MCVQHFAAWIPARYALIHRWLTEVIATTDTHLHIVIATNAAREIALYFWKSMGYVPGVNRMNDFVDVELVDIGNDWCAKRKHAYYAPFVVMPFVFNVHSLTPPKGQQIDPLYSWNSMVDIKPKLTDVGAQRDCLLFLSRGRSGRRSIENEDAMLQYLADFASDHGLELVVHRGVHPDGFDAEKQRFSRAMIVVGPHSGAFGNMIFMQSGSFVVEFNGWLNDDFRAYYYAMAQANGLHYHYVAPQPFHYNKVMTVDMQHLHQVMAAVGESMFLSQSQLLSKTTSLK